MNTPLNELEQILYTTCRSYLPERGIAKIQEAYAFAKAAHSNQLRKSGNAYIEHPTEVAIILAKLEQDTSTICAGLLHDLLEDSEVTKDDIISHFGTDIYNLVEGVTKLGKVYFGNAEEHQAENLRKMLLAMAEDLRVVIIKLADRLHNMRTLKYLHREKQIRIAKETRDIFSPLAHRLGMGSLKWELEDLTFYYLDPEAFQKIKSLVAAKRDERETYIATIIAHLKKILDEGDIEATLFGRPKSFFSINKKITKENIKYEEIYDLLGIRIIVKTVKDCYAVLGLVHANFKPISGRFKDYIAVPKSNMYQSLHTAVIGLGGKPVEVQIRTREMDQVAEYGIAAHWRYKEGRLHTRFDGDFSWLRHILDSYKEHSGGSFLESLKLDLFTDELFVFTPKGDVQVLPIHATPIDFAYKIHTEVGNTCAGARINGVIKPLDYKLQNGDRIEIISNKKQTPKSDWLKLATTNHAKTKIKYWLRKQNAANKIEAGRAELEKELVLNGYSVKTCMNPEALEPLLNKHNFKKSDELFLAVAVGDFSTTQFIRFFDDQFKTLPDTVSDDIMGKVKTKPNKSSAGGITVLGEKNISVYFADCCHPVPGDEIIGFVTRGFGVSVHRIDCPHILHLPAEKQERLVPVDWDSGHSNRYPVSLLIEGFDRIGLLKDISNKISEKKLNIKEFKTLETKADGNIKMEFVVEIEDLSKLNQLRQYILQVPDIVSVQRITKR